MQRLLPIPLVVALCSLVPSTTSAQSIYYVSPTGADTDAGSRDAPWRTLQHAAGTVRPGDEVHVDDGTYAGFELTTSGTAGAPIVFRAMGAGAVIDRDGPTGDGIRLQRTSHVTIEGFTIVDSSNRGISHRGALPTEPSRNITLRNNTVLRATNEGVYLSQVAESLIEGNTVTDAGTSGADRTHCIYLANAGSDNTTLRGNHLSGCGTAGIHFNGDLSIGGDGMISGVVVENNVIHDNGQNGLNMDGVEDALIRNNVVYDNGSNGLRAYRIDAAAGPRGLVIVNNTFRERGWCVRITEDRGDSVVFDNVLLSETGSIALDGTSGFASGYNAVVDRFTPDRDATYWTLAEWQAAGYGTGSFVADEATSFASPTDFHPRAGGPLVGAGVTSFEGVAAPALDADGNARDAMPDVGAYERCAPDCTTVPPDAGPGGIDGGVMTDRDSGRGGDGGGNTDAGPAQHDDASILAGDAGRPPGEGEGGCSCMLARPSAPRGSAITFLGVCALLVLARRGGRRG